MSSNIVKRNTSVQLPKPHLQVKVPKPVKVYGWHLKQVFIIIGICIAGVIAFGVPLAYFIWIVAESLAVPTHIHINIWYWLSSLLITIFWYTGVWAFFNYKDQKKKYGGRWQ